MDERLFRKVALDRLASPDRIDRLPSLARPGIWLLATGFGVLLSALLLIFAMEPEIVLKAEGQVVGASDGLELIFPLPIGTRRLEPGVSVRALVPTDDGLVLARGTATWVSDGEPQQVRALLEPTSFFLAEGSSCQVRVILVSRGIFP